MIKAESSLPIAPSKVNLVGRVFSRLTVIALKETPRGKGRFWICRCECGNQCERGTRVLLDSASPVKSCGCARRESVLKATKMSAIVLTKFTHPHKIKLKWLYRNMVNRCHKPGTRRYERYGGRGISVCQEWRDNPTAFYQWAVANGYSPELWIERKDVNGNYCPENCCFKTPREQANNTSRNRFIDWNGKRQTISQWAEELGCNSGALQHRIARGWTVERMMTEPFRGAD